VSDELDNLFATTPAKFIEERKRVVAALKGAGRKDEAKTVEKIPRPSLPVWTANQIARRDPELVQRLGALTDRLKVAAGAEYGAAATELRQTLEDLRGEAAAVLAAAGHDDAGPHLVQRVIANLRAAAGGAETRKALERGRLERDVEEQEMTSLFGTLGEASDRADADAGGHESEVGRESDREGRGRREGGGPRARESDRGGGARAQEAPRRGRRRAEDRRTRRARRRRRAGGARRG
jgi:hypothetical protein